ncbi:hypothetical protein BH10ACT11_BH10ACT11_17730 [soil metagenome]
MVRRRLYEPIPALVRADEDGRPAALDGIGVEAVREDWVVEDRWWSEQPIRRHYFALTLRNGRSETVFCESGRWFRQRA